MAASPPQRTKLEDDTVPPRYLFMARSHDTRRAFAPTESLFTEVRRRGVLRSSHSPGCRQGVFPETRLAPALSPKHARVRTVPGVPYNIWHTHTLLTWLVAYPHRTG